MNTRRMAVVLSVLLMVGCAAPQTRTEKGAIYGGAGGAAAGWAVVASAYMPRPADVPLGSRGLAPVPGEAVAVTACVRDVISLAGSKGGPAGASGRSSGWLR